MIFIKDVFFIKSATKLEQSPIYDHETVEIAILGRSNVGKSSTINSLVNRKELAKSSNTPGKTKLINFFNIKLQQRLKNSEEIIDEVREFVLVDLPGIGYAKVSKDQQGDWENKLLYFIEKRDNIKHFIYLIDARHPDLELDRGVISYLKTINKNLILIYTKLDKLSNREIGDLKNRKNANFYISNESRKGIDEVREYIFNNLPTFISEISEPNI
jgi:GTP-binding protein